jgi:hypothetical protein
MITRTSTILLVLGGFILLCAGLRHLVAISPVEAQSPPSQAVKDNQELARLYQEDQADRAPVDAKSIDWSSVSKRDRARLSRVKELYEQDLLQSGADYYHAAMILQHGDIPEDFLLAHELCVVAISKGEARAKWLAAASEDRFLTRIGRPQRFGTQYQADGNGPYRLTKVDPGVTDGLRRALDVPSLAEAKAREAELNKK